MPRFRPRNATAHTLAWRGRGIPPARVVFQATVTPSRIYTPTATFDRAGKRQGQGRLSLERVVMHDGTQVYPPLTQENSHAQ